MNPSQEIHREINQHGERRENVGSDENKFALAITLSLLF
jgi:hypothetical protein